MISGMASPRASRGLWEGKCLNLHNDTGTGRKTQGVRPGLGVGSTLGWWAVLKNRLDGWFLREKSGQKLRLFWVFYAGYFGICGHSWTISCFYAGFFEF
jgi:hypothetical protein